MNLQGFPVYFLEQLPLICMLSCSLCLSQNLSSCPLLYQLGCILFLCLCIWIWYIMQPLMMLLVVGFHISLRSCKCVYRWIFESKIYLCFDTLKLSSSSCNCHPSIVSCTFWSKILSLYTENYFLLHKKWWPSLMFPCLYRTAQLWLLCEWDQLLSLIKKEDSILLLPFGCCRQCCFFPIILHIQ